MPTLARSHHLRTEEALSQAAAALDEAGRSLVVVDGAGRVHYQTPGAGPLLARMTRAGGEPTGRLPAAVRTWFLAQVAAATHPGPAGGGPTAPLPHLHEVASVRLRLVGIDADAGVVHYRLSLEPLTDLGEEVGRLIQALRISRREAEVLRWAAAGKNNPEIAIILGVQRSTVRKHLQNTFRRLGLEHRHAAAALTRETLSR